MAEAVGLVFGVIGIVDQLAQRLSNLKARCEDFGSLPDNWHISRKSFEDCRASVKSIEVALVDDKEAIGERATSAFCNILKKAKESLTSAEAILKRLEDDFTIEGSPATESGSSRRTDNSSKLWRRLFLSKDRFVGDRRVNDGKLFFWVKKVKTALEQLDAICKQLEPSIERVAIALVTPSMTTNHTMPSDKYRAHFDQPLLPSRVILNFTADTMEARLKRAILSDSTAGNMTAAVSASLVCAVGMGGVGKSVALHGLCHEPEVQRKYFDGVFFVSLGQDATEKDVIDGVAYFVESSGGRSLATDIKQASSAILAARHASLWFKSKCALFLCDDIWSSDGHPIGYLSSIKLLLCNSPSSVMVISTREKSISQQFVEVKFNPRDVRGQQALSIFVKYAGILTEAIRASSETWSAFQDILDVCAGLPVALAAAGTSLRNLIEENNGSVGRSVAFYARELKENNESVGDESVDEHRGLRAVIETSLRHCENWARGAEGRRKLGCELNVREKFEALSVLRKQSWIPRTCLNRLWETDERATKQLMSKLSDMHLVMRRRQVTPIGDVDGLMLHDLILDQAKALAIENNRAFLWHTLLLNRFMRKAPDNLQAGDSYMCREWWDCKKVPEDGYIEENIARHLAASEQFELESLLSDIRWSMRRMNSGGIATLRNDFQELSSCSERTIGADAVRSALEESWMNINKNVHAIPFELYGRLQSQCRSSSFVQRFLSSVSLHAPKPHYVPKQELRWRADAGQLFRIDFEEQVWDLCSSEDQNVLAVVQGPEIHVFDLQEKSVINTLKSNDRRCNSVVMSADGSRIVSGSTNDTVSVWDVQSGECVMGPLCGHKKSVTCVAMTSDGNRIVSGSLDKTLRVWDGQSGECALGALCGHESFVTCVAISANGSRIVSGSWDKTLRVWDGQSGECVLGPLRGHEDYVKCIAISADGSLIGSGSGDASVRVWDGQSGKCILGPLRGHEHSVTCVTMSADGSRIVSGSWDKTLRVWDVQSGDCVLGPLRGHEKSLTCVTMSGDGSRIVSGSEDASIRVWDVQGGKCSLGSFRGHDNPVSCIAMDAEGSRIASGSCDETVRVWDGSSGGFVLGPLRGHEDSVTCVAMSGDGSRIVSGSGDKTLRVWDGHSGKCMLGPLRGHDEQVTCVAISVQGGRIVSGSNDGIVRVWDGQSGECTIEPLRGHTDSVRCVAVSGDGIRIVSGSRDETVRVWNGTTGVFKCDAVHFVLEIRSLEFDANSNICAVRSLGEDFLLDTSLDIKTKSPAEIVCGRHGRIYLMVQNVGTVQIATMPSECVAFRYNKLHSVAALGLSDGQVVIGKLIA